MMAEAIMIIKVILIYVLGIVVLGLTSMAVVTAIFRWKGLIR